MFYIQNFFNNMKSYTFWKLFNKFMFRSVSNVDIYVKL